MSAEPPVQPTEGEGQAASFDFSAPPPNYEDLVRATASKYNVDPNLAVSIVKHGEWYGKPSDQWGNKATSPKGAAGIMQLMPATAARFGVTNRFDPVQSVEGGMRYLRFLGDKFNNDPDLMSAGYNAGEGAVQGHGNQVPPYKETQAYVKRVKQGLQQQVQRFDFSAPTSAPQTVQFDFSAPPPVGTSEPSTIAPSTDPDQPQVSTSPQGKPQQQVATPWTDEYTKGLVPQFNEAKTAGRLDEARLIAQKLGERGYQVGGLGSNEWPWIKGPGAEGQAAASPTASDAMTARQQSDRVGQLDARIQDMIHTRTVLQQEAQKRGQSIGRETTGPIDDQIFALNAERQKIASGQLSPVVLKAGEELPADRSSALKPVPPKANTMIGRGIESLDAMIPQPVTNAVNWVMSPFARMFGATSGTFSSAMHDMGTIVNAFVAKDPNEITKAAKQVLGPDAWKRRVGIIEKSLSGEQMTPEEQAYATTPAKMLFNLVVEKYGGDPEAPDVQAAGNTLGFLLDPASLIGPHTLVEAARGGLPTVPEGAREAYNKTAVGKRLPVTTEAGAEALTAKTTAAEAAKTRAENIKEGKWTGAAVQEPPLTAEEFKQYYPQKETPHATETRQEQGDNQAEFRGVRPGTNIPTHEGEVREGQGGQAEGSRGAEQRPEVGEGDGKVNAPNRQQGERQGVEGTQNVGQGNGTVASPTDSSVQRWRGSNAPIHLDEQGRETITREASGLPPNVEVWHSPEERGRETAQIVSDTSGAKSVEKPGLTPRDNGLTGQQVTPENVKQYTDFTREHPDQPPPWGGEAFNPLKQRIIDTANEALDKSADDGKSRILIMHNSELNVLKGRDVAEAAGATDPHAVDMDAALADQLNEHGGLTKVYRDEQGRMKVDGDTDPQDVKPGEVYVMRHGHTPWNGPEQEPVATGTTPADRATISPEMLTDRISQYRNANYEGLKHPEIDRLIDKPNRTPAETDRLGGLLGSAIDGDRTGLGQQVRESSTEPGSRAGAVEGQAAPRVERTTGIKNETVNAERAERNLSPMQKEVARQWEPTVHKDAMEIVGDDPTAFRSQVRAWAAQDWSSKTTRPLNDAEQLAVEHDRVTLHDEIKASEGRLDQALKDGDKATILKEGDHLAVLREHQELNDYVAEKAGTAAGRTLNIRQAMMKDDYSVSRSEQRARIANEMGKWSDAAMEKSKARIADASAKMDEIGKKLAAQPQARMERDIAQAVKRAQQEADLEARRTGRARTKETLAAEWDQLGKEALKLGSTPSMNRLFDPEAYKLVGKMVRNRVEAGVNVAADLVDVIHNALKNKFEGLSVRDVQEAISGYGRPASEQTRSDLLTQIGRMKQEIGRIPKREDIAAGVEPWKREGKTAEQTILEGQQQLRNETDELDRRLGGGEVKAKGEKPAPTAETQALTAERDVLKRQLEDPTAKNKTDVQKRLDEVEKKIATGDLSKQEPEFPRRIYDDAETTAMRARLKDANEQLNDLRKAARTPEEVQAQALKAYKSARESQIAEYERRLREGDYTKRTKADLALDAEAQGLRTQQEKLKKQIDGEIEKIRLANRSAAEKAYDMLLKWRRFGMLSGGSTLGKLGGAAATRTYLVNPLDTLIGGAASQVPGLRTIAEQAHGEGGFGARALGQSLAKPLEMLPGGSKLTSLLTHSDSIEARAAQISHATTGEVKSQQMAKLRQGKSNIDVLYSKRAGPEDAMAPSALEFFGRLHGAIKEPARLAAFEQSMTKRLSAMAREGADMSDPATQATAGAAAYADANRAIFMQPNAFVTKLGAVPGVRAFIPIMTVPTNYIAETFARIPGIGAIVPGVKGVKAIAEALKTEGGLKNLSTGDADMIMRAIKQQGTGIGMLALGYALGPSIIGGFAGQKGSERGSDVGEGEIKIGSLTVPHLLTHNPAFEILKIGATLRAVHRDYGGAGEAASRIGKGMAKAIPFIDEPARIERAFQSGKTVQGAVGGMLKDFIIPRGIQEIAQGLDPASGKKFLEAYISGKNAMRRAPRDIPEEFKMGFPGLRKDVPRP